MLLFSEIENLLFDSFLCNELLEFLFLFIVSNKLLTLSFSESSESFLCSKFNSIIF